MIVATPEPSMPSRLSRRPAVSMIRCLVSCLCSFAYRTVRSSVAAGAYAPAAALVESVCWVGKERSEVDPRGLRFRVGGLGAPPYHGSSKFILQSYDHSSPTSPRARL